MVYIKRDSNNQIIAIFDKDTDEHLEKLPSTDKEVHVFLAKCHVNHEAAFLKTDLELIRVIEDLVQILIAKNVIAITDFPIAAIEKLTARNKIREQYKGISGIMDKI
ncbi:MAG: hypothetical protein Q8R24_08145 [Legionellaceae bacterium]|nr:hypothetical protein [Legionellaceae bacterium]